eukprot:TRINITY_DN6497_c0_g1_i1.p1 TRINITY_DN6497_c0_g1~~TRINITY_DN6497_c0_g1_i1.p1  ORF type:complete len:516 (+),score=81.74 TRINITY_DN6497_c0_g1_i1:67-1614(+)
MGRARFPVLLGLLHVWNTASFRAFAPIDFDLEDRLKSGKSSGSSVEIDDDSEYSPASDITYRDYSESPLDSEGQRSASTGTEPEADMDLVTPRSRASSSLEEPAAGDVDGDLVTPRSHASSSLEEPAYGDEDGERETPKPREASSLEEPAAGDEDGERETPKPREASSLEEPAAGDEDGERETPKPREASSLEEPAAGDEAGDLETPKPREASSLDEPAAGDEDGERETPKPREASSLEEPAVGDEDGDLETPKPRESSSLEEPAAGDKDGDDHVEELGQEVSADAFETDADGSAANMEEVIGESAVPQPGPPNTLGATPVEFKPGDKINFLKAGQMNKDPKGKKGKAVLGRYKAGSMGTIRKQLKRGLYLVCVGDMKDTLIGSFGFSRVGKDGTYCPGGEVKLQASAMKPFVNTMLAWDEATNSMQEREVEEFKVGEAVKILIGGVINKKRGVYGRWTPGTKGFISRVLVGRDRNHYYVCITQGGQGELKKLMRGYQCTGVGTHKFPAFQLEKM